MYINLNSQSIVTLITDTASFSHMVLIAMFRTKQKTPPWRIVMTRSLFEVDVEIVHFVTPGVCVLQHLFRDAVHEERTLRVRADVEPFEAGVVDRLQRVEPLEELTCTGIHVGVVLHKQLPNLAELSVLDHVPDLLPFLAVQIQPHNVNSPLKQWYWPCVAIPFVTGTWFN